MFHLRHAAIAAACIVPALHAQVPGREVTSGNTSIQLRIESEGSSGADPAARLAADAQQWSQSLGPIKPGTQPQTKSGRDGLATAWSLQFGNEPNYLHLFMTTDRSSAICHLRAPNGFKTMFIIQGPVQRCMTELRSASTNTAAAAPPNTSASTTLSPTTSRPAASRPPRPGAPPPAASADAPPAHPENWNNVADVLFRTTYTGGVGGMLVVDYEPLILFRDGSYFEIANQALEDVDIAAERAARPVHFGTWRAQGITYILTDNKGRPHDYKLQDGNLFKAHDAAKGGPLNMRYKRVSGGGNSALGGDVSILIQSNIAFTPDGRFTSGQNVGALNSGNTSGVSSAAGSNRRNGLGTYKLNHYTIELHYPDGHSERKFFAYSSAHAAAELDHEMIFIGDSPYIHDK